MGLHLKNIKGNDNWYHRSGVAGVKPVSTLTAES